MTIVLRERETIREREIEIRMDRPIREPRPWPMRRAAIGTAQRAIATAKKVLLLEDRRQGELFAR